MAFTNLVLVPLPKPLLHILKMPFLNIRFRAVHFCIIPMRMRGGIFFQLDRGSVRLGVCGSTAILTWAWWDRGAIVGPAVFGGTPGLNWWARRLLLFCRFLCDFSHCVLSSDCVFKQWRLFCNPSLKNWILSSCESPTTQITWSWWLSGIWLHILRCKLSNILIRF